MRQVLRLIGNRYGAAVTILVVIAVVVGFGRLIGGSHRGSQLSSGPGPAVATTPSTSTSPQPDDGMDWTSEAPVSPSVSPGTVPAETVAVAFAKAWLHHDNVSATDWHNGMARYSTKALSDRLDGVDPGSVPAEQMTGAATVDDQESSYVDVAIPCDAGTLVLRVVTVSGHWLVDGVDWRRS